MRWRWKFKNEAIRRLQTNLRFQLIFRKLDR
jgi:hypothetical protein